jgi:hypothetical protein
MDTTPEYIKMCEKAVEIRETWKPRDGDWFSYGSVYLIANYQRGNVVAFAYDPEALKRSPHMSEYYDHAFRQFDGGYDWEDKFICYQHHGVWLPRQDQLQEMIEGHWSEVLGRFTYWLDGPNSLVSIPTIKLLKERVDFVKRLERIDSMEQLWLAFVMKEKYGKIWNGEEWVII